MAGWLAESTENWPALAGAVAARLWGQPTVAGTAAPAQGAALGSRAEGPAAVGPARSAAQLPLEALRSRLQRIVDAITCPISLDVIVEARQLPCGHVFDRAPLERALAHQPFCPCCREWIGRLRAVEETIPHAAIGTLAHRFRRALPRGMADADEATLRRAGAALADCMADDWQPPESWSRPAADGPRR